MAKLRNRWALILAAGDGTRLAKLTRDAAGFAVPKQYCTFAGGRTLLHQAIDRSARVAARSRIVTVVAAQHRRWWETDVLPLLTADNVCVQPANRGTAAGVLLPLLAILDRDPLARIVFLPSDHYVVDEAVLAQEVERALRQIERRPDEIVLLGIAPEENDAEFGWIVPHVEGRGAVRVRRFVEKPGPAVARELLDRGGLWNSFIFAATGPVMLRLFERKLPQLVAGLRAALRDVAAGRTGALERLYHDLPTHDFSRDVLAGSERMLTVLRVRSCGWNDLGTPDRVVRCVVRPQEQRHFVGPGPRVDLGRAATAPSLG
jgi:mannose-1-phosphate guanylyltransferase